jgi:uncharacterized lipoprotein YajG
MKESFMKYLFFIAVLAAVLMTAGCFGEDQNAEVTPARTTAVPTTVP